MGSPKLLRSLTLAQLSIPGVAVAVVGASAPFAAVAWASLLIAAAVALVLTALVVSPRFYTPAFAQLRLHNNFHVKHAKNETQSNPAAPMSVPKRIVTENDNNTYDDEEEDEDLIRAFGDECEAGMLYFSEPGTEAEGPAERAESIEPFGYLYHEGGVVGTVLDDVVIQASLPSGTDVESASDGEWVSPTNGYIYHALIGYNLANQTVQGAGLRNLGTLFLVYVQRDGKQIGAVGPDFVLKNGDVLGFAGTTDNFAAFCDSKRLTSMDDVLAQGVEAFTSHFHVFSMVEPALVRSKSQLIGKTAKELGFRSRYNASIISISRAGSTFSKASWGHIQLRPFDTLLLLKGERFSWDAPDTARDLKPPASPFKNLDSWPIREDERDGLV